MAKITKKITLFGKDDKGILNRTDRAQIRNLVKEELIIKVINDMNDGRSSVSGRRWKGLSSDYKKFKASKGGSSFADLFLSGKYQRAFKARNTSDGIEIGIFAPSQQGKADGHNNHTGRSKLPKRQSVPKRNESFRPGIINPLSVKVENETKKIVDKKLTKLGREIDNFSLKIK